MGNWHIGLKNQTLLVCGNWPIGHKVLTMNANDPDFKENGTVTYKIIKDGLFFVEH